MEPRNRRPWNRAEKLLLFAPLVVVAAMFGIGWLRSQVLPRRVMFPEGYNVRLRLSPDGKAVLIGASRQGFLTPTGLTSAPSLGLYDVQNGLLLRDFPQLKTSSAWGFSSDGKTLVVYERTTKTIRRVEIDSGRVLWERPVLQTPSWLTFSSDDKTVFSTPHTLSIWDADSGRALQPLTAHAHPFGHPDLRNSRDMMVLTSSYPAAKKAGESKLMNFDGLNGIRRVIFKMPGPSFDYSISRDRQWLARVYHPHRQGTLDLWSIQRRKKQWTLQIGRRSNAYTAFSPTSEVLIAATNTFGADKNSNWQQGTVRAYDITTGRLLWNQSTNGWIPEIRFVNQDVILCRQVSPQPQKLIFRNAKDGYTLREISKPTIDAHTMTPDKQTLIVTSANEVHFIDVSDLRLNRDEK